jgi:Leucine-rich repeat (LRR) protein
MKTEIEISPYGSSLVYKKGYTVEFVRSTIKERNLKGLRIFAHLSENRLDDLSFLHEYSFLKALDISSVNDYDFSFLSSLTALQDLSISIEGKNEIDLSHQVKLESLDIEWRKGKISGLEKCQNITNLCLIDFIENDFSAVSQLINLKELMVKTASIKTLNGVQHFPLLEKLLLGNCRNLESIEDIVYLKNLASLHIELCAKIKDYIAIGKLTRLKRLRLIDCREISSIKFIENLHSLNKLSLLGNTDILDGDMIPAKNIEEVFYRHRKHYNIKIENKEHEELIKSNLEKIKRSFNR